MVLSIHLLLPARWRHRAPLPRARDGNDAAPEPSWSIRVEKKRPSMSSWCQGASPATRDGHRPLFLQAAQMCLPLAAPPPLSALRSSCWWQEGHASTLTSPLVLRAPPRTFSTAGLCLVTSSAQLLAGNGAQGQTPRHSAAPPSQGTPTVGAGPKGGSLPQGLSSSRGRFPSPPFLSDLLHAMSKS